MLVFLGGYMRMRNSVLQAKTPSPLRLSSMGVTTDTLALSLLPAHTSVFPLLNPADSLEPLSCCTRDLEFCAQTRCIHAVCYR